MTEPYRFGRRAYTCCSIAIHFARHESYPLPAGIKHAGQLAYRGVLSWPWSAVCAACTSNPTDAPPPTIAPAEAAVSPPVTRPPAGVVRPTGRPREVRGVRCRDRIVGGARLRKGRSGGGHRDAREGSGPGRAAARCGDGDDRRQPWPRLRVDARRVFPGGHRATAWSPGWRSTVRATPISPRSPAAPTASWCSAAPTARSTR